MGRCSMLDLGKMEAWERARDRERERERERVSTFASNLGDCRAEITQGNPPKGRSYFAQ